MEKKTKEEMLEMIEKLRNKSSKNLIEGEYKNGFLDGLGILWIDLNYEGKRK